MIDFDPNAQEDTQVLKVFRIVRKTDAFVGALGPHVVDAAMARELFQNLSQVVPHGPCLFDWKIEHHKVDELDESGRRWPGAKEGDVVVQGYIRYQIPKGE